MIKKLSSKISPSIIDYYIQKKGNNKKILILLHGYGSSKDDLKNLIPSFNKLRDTIFVVPNAPFTCDIGIGYQWFPVEFSSNNIDYNFKESLKALTILFSFIEKISKENNITFNNISIFGFSQGAVMALSLSLLLPYKFSAIVAHSGMFFDYNNDITKLNSSLNNKQNILLIHGKKDEVVPFSFAEKTQKFLDKNGIKYSVFFKEDLGHFIDEETLERAQKFLTHKDR